MSSNDETDPINTLVPALTDDRTLENGDLFGQPRSNILTWEEYFMSLAFLSAQRSKDPVSQVGACIVNKRNQIVGIGYNGMPRGCPEIWEKNEKKLYVCHAEMNAILNKNSADVSGCTIYVALFPCNECAKLIIQAGINKIVYFSDKKKDKWSTIASKRMLDETDVKYRPFVVWGRRELTLDFNAVKAEFPDSDLSGQAPDGRADIGSANDNQEGRIESPRPPISWEEYFMAVAFLSAQRSKDPLSQVGACIVNADKRIVAIGYNGMPCGCRDENMPWQDSDSLVGIVDSKSSYMCHAVLTAIMNKNGADVRGYTMYVTRFPCHNCAKLISQAGLSKVVYYTEDGNRDDSEEIASRNIPHYAKVSVTQFSMENPTARTRIAINFESINR